MRDQRAAGDRLGRAIQRNSGPVNIHFSAAVGIGISVTTIPASAYLGVAAGTGELGKSWSALGVLGANIAMMLLGGSIALAVQRLRAPRMPDEPPAP